MGYKAILIDIKTYLSIKLKNPKRFKDSKVDSFVSKNVTIGRFVTIKKNVLITESLKSIGTGSYIGDYSSLFNCESVGNYCSISHGVKIGLENHLLNGISTSPLLYNKPKYNKPTVIENDVLISADVLIMSGLRIGTGSIIGAGSFVNKDVPPYSIVVGQPAKVIKYRYSEEVILELLNSKWWEKDVNILKNMNLENIDPISFINLIKDIE
jgi:virginiamycin A acetyltransferase